MYIPDKAMYNILIFIRAIIMLWFQVTDRSCDKQCSHSHKSSKLLHSLPVFSVFPQSKFSDLLTVFLLNLTMGTCLACHKTWHGRKMLHVIEVSVVCYSTYDHNLGYFRLSWKLNNLYQLTINFPALFGLASSVSLSSRCDTDTQK